ncbi:hypothetical protein TNCV_3949521 [Trichonephila clavipes]|nr:hypothetical protein TNCV_3949521 [Trichonephila clavipes]
MITRSQALQKDLELLFTTYISIFQSLKDFGESEYSLCSGIFDVKDAPRTGRPIVENVYKITEIIEVDRHIRSRSITQERKIATEKQFKPFGQSCIQKEARCLGGTPFNTKKHDGSNFHLRSLG